MPFSRFERSWFSALGLVVLGGSALWGQAVRIDNGIVAFSLTNASGEAAAGKLSDAATRTERVFRPGEAWIALEGQSPVRFGALRQTHLPVLSLLEANPGAARAAEREPGQAIVLNSVDPAKRYAVQWRSELRQSSRYVIVRLRITNLGLAALPVQEVGLMNETLPQAIRVGSFLGVEHPLAQNELIDGQVRCVMPVHRSLSAGETLEIKGVWGFASPGQLRRDFLAYLERERPRAYAPFLHYNTWYSIGYFNPYSESDLARIIAAFHQELTVQRGLALNGFVLDDGWDDPRSIWNFGSGFPHGLRRAQALAQAAGASLGIWLSPWGGYGKPKALRLAQGGAAVF
jgi:hypothetical protein